MPSSCFTAIASQINLRDEAKAKSRTLSALKIHVFLPVAHAGGSIEHYNEEAGATWLKRLTDTYASAAWINPTPEAYWGHSASTSILKALMTERMYPLTLTGLEEATRELSRKR